MSNESNPNPGHQHESAPEQAAISPRKALVGVAVVVVVAGALAGFGIWSRIHADKNLAERTEPGAIGQRITGRIRVERHGTEFQQRELPIVKADALLTKQNREAVSHPDGEGYEGHQGRCADERG